MQREVPPEALSRVSSYDALGSLMLMPVGLLLAGPSVDVIGVNAALLITAAVTVVASVAALCSPGVRNLEWSTRPLETSFRQTQPSELPLNPSLPIVPFPSPPPPSPPLPSPPLPSETATNLGMPRAG